MKPEAFIILTPGFAADQNDSACIPFHQSFVGTLKELFPQLNIIVITFQYPFTHKEYNWNNCKVIPLGGKEKSKIFRLMIWQKAWQKLKQLHKQYDIKGLLSFWCGECAFIGNRFSKKYGVLHKCWLQGQDAKAGNKYVKRIDPKNEDVIALSDFLAMQFYENYAISPANTIPPGIDPSLFKSNNFSRSIDILGVGSLISLKQYDVFINSVNNLRKTWPQIKATIVGKGPEENKLKELVAKNNLQSNIFFTGELSHNEVLLLMQQCKILLHTSYYEGFGVVCLEALQAGCKVVSFIQPMQQEIDNWQTINTEEEMADTLNVILKDKTFEYRAVTPFLITESAKQVMHLYNYNAAAT